MWKTLCAEVLIKGKEKKNLEIIITIIIEKITIIIEKSNSKQKYPVIIEKNNSNNRKTKIPCSSRDSCLLLWYKGIDQPNIIT